MQKFGVLVFLTHGVEAQYGHGLTPDRKILFYVPKTTERKRSVIN